MGKSVQVTSCIAGSFFSGKGKRKQRQAAKMPVTPVSPLVVSMPGVGLVVSRLPSLFSFPSALGAQLSFSFCLVEGWAAVKKSWENFDFRGENVSISRSDLVTATEGPCIKEFYFAAASTERGKRSHGVRIFLKKG